MNAALVSKQKRRDWFTIIRVHLVYAGVSQLKVASACHRDPKTVENWIYGGEPKDTDARIVLALYKQHCPEQYEQHMREFQPDMLQLSANQPKKTSKMKEIDQMDLFMRAQT